MSDSKQKTKRLLDRYRFLKIQRSRWLLHWEDLARIMLPRRVGFSSETYSGERRTEEIYDGTAMRSARGLGNAVGQLLRPEGDKWFFIRPENEDLKEDDEVADWLRFAEEKLRAKLYHPKARFRQATGEADLDLVVFGTAVVFVTTAADDRKRLQFNTIDLKDAVIGLDVEGNPDTLFQARKFTVREAAKKFGREKLSQELQDKLNSNSGSDKDEKYDFLRVIEPRGNGRDDAQLARNMKYTDNWIEVAAEQTVKEGGFRSFPAVIPRWDTSSGEVYGRSPGMIALPDAETSNAMSETILVSGQKAADAPIFAPSESSFDAVNTYSGGITYYDVDVASQMGGNPFFTLKQDFNLPITRDMQLDVRQQIEAAFFKNVFNLPVKGPEMTATEVMVRKEEFIREIGAVFGRFESDYQSPMIERAFELMLRAGEFDPIPEMLMGEDVNFDYTSPIKKIREQAEVAATRIWMQDITMLQAINQEVIDIVNTDEIARFEARALDLPTQFINAREQVEENRAARKQIQKDQQELAAGQAGMDILATGGKAAESMDKAFGPGGGGQGGAGGEGGEAAAGPDLEGMMQQLTGQQGG